jgi:hypothetical protein
VETTSRKISGQAYLAAGCEEGWDVLQGGDFRAERRRRRSWARSRRKIASLPFRCLVSGVHDMGWEGMEDIPL